VFSTVLKETGIRVDYEGTRKSERLRSVCNMFLGGRGVHYSRRMGEISHDSAVRGGLLDFARSSVPCVIRGGGGRKGRDWSAEGLKGSYGSEQVNTLIFERGDRGGGDKGGDINTVLCSFEEFAGYAMNGFEIVSEGGDGEAKQEIYLLLTSRGLEGALAIDPNPNSRMLELLREVGFEDTILEEAGLSEAWSNVRIGVGYDYPVHIDCFDNIIVQLKGKKTVNVWDPETVEGWRPRLNKKHWPGTTEEERRGKWKDVIENGSWGSVELGEGDAIFIPAMYFHSVNVEEGGWSVTGNRYYFGGDSGEEKWKEVMETRKKRRMRAYEERERNQVC